jgi:hypothetical protein
MLASCGGSDGGAEGGNFHGVPLNTPSAGPVGSSCATPGLEGCLVQNDGKHVRMHCELVDKDSGLMVWMVAEACSIGQVCRATSPTAAKATECTAPSTAPPDASAAADSTPGGQADAGTTTSPDTTTAPQDTGGGAADTAAPLPAINQLDPKCLDGQYTETLASSSASIQSDIAAYTKNDYLQFIYAVLAKRYPLGKVLIEGAIKNASQNCVDLFLPDAFRNSAGQVIGRLEVVVHECGHFYDMYPMKFGSTKYMIRQDLVLNCNGCGSTSKDTGSFQSNASFPRSEITKDSFAKKRPSCDQGKGSHGCDSYAKVYLNGSPTNGKFESGDQGFNLLMEEVVQYVNSLAVKRAFVDHVSFKTSARDGILTLLWYMQRYLHMARTQHPKVYAYITSQSCWRELILSVWGRAFRYLEATKNEFKLTIDGAKIEPLVLDPVLMNEIQLIRKAHGCP